MNDIKKNLTTLRYRNVVSCHRLGNIPECNIDSNRLRK